MPVNSKMKEHVNFYENLKEAVMRLRHTIVLYDGEPVYVRAITDHKKDGIFRMYLDPLHLVQKSGRSIPDVSHIPSDHESLGPLLDQFMDENPNSGLLRKQMNSPKFNKFRPFPLGMCNIHGQGTSYVERQPVRPRTEQGLVRAALYEIPVTASKMREQRFTLDMFTEAFKDCILGRYPTAKDCITNLQDPDVTNEAAAFDRNFAFVRGPINMIFLAYKDNVVGVLPKGDLSVVKLGRDFTFVKEAVEELNLFSDIQ